MLLFNSPTFQLSNLPFRAGAGRRASVAGGAREVYRGRFGVCVKVRRPTPNAPAPTLYSIDNNFGLPIVNCMMPFNSQFSIHNSAMLGVDPFRHAQLCAARAGIAR